MSLFVNKKIFFISITFLLIVSSSLYSCYLLMDEYTTAKFRTMQDKISSFEDVNLKGLDKLPASGGPLMDFPTLKKKLSSITKSIIIVDSKREEHGYIKDIPTIYFGYRNNKSALRFHVRRLLYTGTTQLQPALVVREQEVAKKYGFEYVRLRVDSKNDAPVTAIDSFVTYFEKIPENVWFHFHCRGGKGRTSLALVMLDIMQNAPEVSLEDIVKRQHLLGSVDLFDTVVWRKNSTYTLNALEQRKKFIQDFYDFIVQRKVGGIQLWSEWRSRAQEVRHHVTGIRE